VWIGKPTRFAMQRNIADFNRDWPDVTRTRELLVLAEELTA
jgi:hypothetical protein